MIRKVKFLISEREDLPPPEVKQTIAITNMQRRSVDSLILWIECESLSSSMFKEGGMNGDGGVMMVGLCLHDAPIGRL